MNSCILMAKIISNPELRYTQDNQTPVTDMWIEFEGSQSNEPPSTLRAVGWGTLASEIQQKYSEGDVVIIEGRLSMNTVPRPDGLKEKRAELIVSRIYPINVNNASLPSFSSEPASTHADDGEHEDRESWTPSGQTGDRFTSINSSESMAETEYEDREPTIAAPASKPKKTEKKKVPTPTIAEPVEQDLDDIPFLRPVSLPSNEIDLQDPWESNARSPVWLHGTRDLWS